MGTALGKLTTKLARIPVAPHVRRVDGEVVAVEGYLREGSLRPGIEVYAGDVWTGDRTPPETPDELAIVETLGKLGGRKLAWMGRDADSRIIARRGRVFGGRSVLKRGKPNDCHANTSRLWRAGKVDRIVTGYALSADGIWRQHTWGLMDSGQVVETTVKRELYYGVVLAPAEAAKFAEHNP